MSDSSMPEEPTGSCPVCWGRDPHRPQVCWPCRSWLDGILGDIRIGADELAHLPDTDVRDMRIAPIRGRDGYAARNESGNLVLRWRDPVAHHQPAAPVPARSRQPRVSGAQEPPVPANLAVVDITLPARLGSRSPHARGVLGSDPDQIGGLSLATMLETWCVDWATTLGFHRPPPTINAMTGWLREHLEWACDGHQEIGGFADDLRVYRSALRRMLGQNEYPDYKQGVACPECHGWSLEQQNGSQWVTCSMCPTMLSPAEYHQWVHDEATRRAQQAEVVSAA